MKWPVLILVRPEIPENLGFVARTMHCFGLTHWRIVGANALTFETGGPVRKTASGADAVLETCERMASLEEATADCHEVWGFSRRAHGGMLAEALSDALLTYSRAATTKRLAFVFGPESQGLNGQDATCIQRWIRIESSHPTMSLNLSHAIAIALHAWQTRHLQNEVQFLPTGTAPSAHLDEALADRGLLEKGWQVIEDSVKRQQVFPVSKESAQLKHLRGLWNRISVTQGEGEFLVGIAKVLLQGRQPRQNTDQGNGLLT